MSYDRVSKLCTIAHETVDECVTDDISVVAPPLVIGRLGCPVLDRLLLRLGDGQWRLPESVDVTESELATTLMLPTETVARYPMVGRFGLLARCMDRLQIADADAERSLVVLDAWLALFRPDADGRACPYPIWALPGRDAFEGWLLLARLDILYKLGYAGRLANEDMETACAGPAAHVRRRPARRHPAALHRRLRQARGRRLAGPGRQDHRCRDRRP